MENPFKNAVDFFNPEDLERHRKAGVTKFIEFSSLPSPDDPIFQETAKKRVEYLRKRDFIKLTIGTFSSNLSLADAMRTKTIKKLI